MLKQTPKFKLRNKRGQMIASEYVITLFVVVAVISGMSVYFRRAVQGRIRDAHNSVLNIVKERIGTAYAGNQVYIQYEPYYRISDDIAVVANNDTRQVLPSYPLSSGLYRLTPNQQTFRSGNTTTLPPVNAD
ncbi:MAG: hypothetical protein K8I00_00705 [Candidatus Omnitrophica bacterium]|nr:hypothetical protein [Candidatus Omnitrophota bacterium]